MTYGGREEASKALNKPTKFQAIAVDLV